MKRPVARFLATLKNDPGCRGFTYLSALMVVMIMGIMLGMVGQSWKTIVQRDKEEELLFRGLQYKRAFQGWYSTAHKAGPPPRDLNDLLEDPTAVSKKRYLRRIYKDPMTGKDFDLLKNATGGISGVVSSSNEMPFKVQNFPSELKEFEGKSKYSDWRFGYKLAPLPGDIGTENSKSAQPGDIGAGNLKK